MDWQQKSAEFAKKHNLIHDPGVHLIDLTSELDEVAKEWLLATHTWRNRNHRRGALTQAAA